MQLFRFTYIFYKSIIVNQTYKQLSKSLTMKKAIVPPVLLTVANTIPLRIIATKTIATVINENSDPFWSSSRIIKINEITREITANRPGTILTADPEWYANYE